MKAPPSLTLRSLRAVFCLWLAFVLTQPVAVHACAMRNGTLMAAPAATSHGGQSMAAMHGGAAQTMGHDASSPAGQTNGGCHCFGECSVSASVALLPPPLAVPAPPNVLAERPLFTFVEHSFEQPDFLQPPATAPPAAPAIA